MADKSLAQIPVKNFLGLAILPKAQDVPGDYASSCQNVAYLPGAVLGRPGTSQKIALGGGLDSFHMEIRLWPTGRYHLILMDGPALYSSFEAAARVLLKSGLPASVNHFRQQAYGSRVFFTFSDSDLGKTAPFVWDPATGNFDPATEAAPAVGTFAAANSVAAGSVDAGVHKLVVIYETRGGYQTAPSASISVTAAGAKKLDLSGIPLGGATITKRLIGMTAAGLGTFYLALTIANNVDTTATIDVADAQLIQQLELTDFLQFKHPLPNLMGVIQYRDRMVYWGDSADANLLWISKKGAPATIRADLGFLVVNKEDGDRIVNCFVLGNVLHIVKTRSLYSIVDNGNEPFNWGEPRQICSWCGTLSPSGVALSNDQLEAFILDVKGVYSFRGGDPVSLSDAIQPYFEDDSSAVTPINHAALKRSECHFDPQDRRVFAWVPTGASTVPDTLLVCDLREGQQRLKWAPWIKAGVAWRSFAVDSIEVNISEAGAFVSKLDDTAISDRDGSLIDWHYQPGVLGLADDGIHLLGGVGARASGSGTLVLSIYDQDKTLLASPAGFALSATPGKDFFRRVNQRKERFFFRVGQNAFASAMISQLNTYMKPDGVRRY